jgi:hypothetical protein
VARHLDLNRLHHPAPPLSLPGISAG